MEWARTMFERLSTRQDPHDLKRLPRRVVGQLTHYPSE